MDTHLALLFLRFCLGDQAAPKGSINAYLQGGNVDDPPELPHKTLKSTERTNLPIINEKLL